MAAWVNARVDKVINWTESLFSVIVTAPIDPFTAGQYAKLALEVNGERVVRAYSFVNAPGNKNLEFYLVVVPEGKLSPRLHALKPGDEVMITQDAQGFFVVDEIPQCETLWMLATGTAIGPYLSILEEGKGLERFSNIVLVHAARYARDLSYLPQMQRLQERYKNQLHIQMVVSREQADGALTGRIPALIDSGQLEAATGLSINAEASHVMLCGNPEMVKDTQQLLKDSRGMRKHFKRKPGHITSEFYW